MGGIHAMRIIAWNCNMALHKKYEHLLALRPDIAVIPECAHPDLIAERAPEFLPSWRDWIGHNRHKGLGVFTFGDFHGKLSPIYKKDFPFIAPISIEGPTRFNLLAVWACHRKPNSFNAGLGPLRRALSAYRGFIEELPTIVAGDFNDNARWHRAGRLNNHLFNVSELAALGLRSAYHHARNIEQGGDGEEPTLYWRDRKSDGHRYHVDYCFVPERWSISAVTIGHFDPRLSDHVPLIVEINTSA
jgi:exodeoxyribonuclease III